MAIYTSHYYAGPPAATLRLVSPGRAVDIGVPAVADFQGALVDWLLPLLDVESLLDKLPGVKVSFRSGSVGQVLFLPNHNGAPAAEPIPEE